MLINEHRTFKAASTNKFLNKLLILIELRLLRTTDCKFEQFKMVSNTTANSG